LLDAICNRYGKRPSEVIGITNEFEAIDFDCTILVRASRINRENEDNMGTTETNTVPRKSKKYSNENAKINSQFAAMAALQSSTNKIRATGSK